MCARLTGSKILSDRNACMTVYEFTADFVFNRCQESGSRVVFGRNKHSSPPPIRSPATMKVGAGQYMSRS